MIVGCVNNLFRRDLTIFYNKRRDYYFHSKTSFCLACVQRGSESYEVCQVPVTRLKRRLHAELDLACLRQLTTMDIKMSISSLLVIISVTYFDY